MALAQKPTSSSNQEPLGFTICSTGRILLYVRLIKASGLLYEAVK